MLGCSKTKLPQLKQGSIYGWIVLEQQEGAFPELPEDFSIVIQGVDMLIYPMESESPHYSGMFYIPDIPTGKYTFVGMAEGFRNGTFHDLEVQEDSLSYIVLRMNRRIERENEPFILRWKVANTNVSKSGTLEGYISGGLNGRVGPLEGAVVKLLGTMYQAKSDSTGYYRIAGVIPGEYVVTVYYTEKRNLMTSVRFTPVYEDFKIKADSVAFVNMKISGRVGRRLH